MNAWLIASLILFIVCVIGTILSVLNDEGDWGFISVLLGIIAALLIIAFVLTPIERQRTTSVFEQQKAYIETHQAKTPVEDAAITTKKIELNQWLMYAQWSKNKWGDWSFYPDRVLDLELIQ